jgi:hypothetical protein
MSGYVYVQSEKNLWTVGFNDPNGLWHPDSDHSTREAAAERTAWLNGSHPPNAQPLAKETFIIRLRAIVSEMEEGKLTMPEASAALEYLGQYLWRQHCRSITNNEEVEK